MRSSPVGSETYTLLELLNAARPSWHRRAACRGVGSDLFFIGRGGDTAPAKTMCSVCPVSIQCAQAGEDQVHGIWGGMSGRQRRATRRTAA